VADKCDLHEEGFIPPSRLKILTLGFCCNPTITELSKMIFGSQLRVAIPTNDVLSYIFDNPKYDPDLPVFIDTNDPRRSISCNQARKTIRQLIAGFRARGLRKGDCVSIHSFNDVSSSCSAFRGRFPFLTVVVIAFAILDSN